MTPLRPQSNTGVQSVRGGHRRVNQISQSMTEGPFSNMASRGLPQHYPVQPKAGIEIANFNKPMTGVNSGSLTQAEESQVSGSRGSTEKLLTAKIMPKPSHGQNSSETHFSTRHASNIGGKSGHL